MIRVKYLMKMLFFEDYVLFYNPAKSRFDEEDYLVTISYEPKKGLSREFFGLFLRRP